MTATRGPARPSTGRTTAALGRQAAGGRTTAEAARGASGGARRATGSGSGRSAAGTDGQARTARTRATTKQTGGERAIRRKVRSVGREVDPRLQARRSQVARAEGRRRLSLVAALTVVATLAVAAIAVANSSWLDVETVSVVGAARADADQIITSSGVTVGQPLVRMRPAMVSAAVERVPWVDSAVVRRGWRGAVTIEVTERQPLVAMAAGSRYALVDATGRQLEIVASPPEGLLVVQGEEASGVPGQPVPEVAVPALALAGQLSPKVAPMVTGLVVDNGDILADLSIGGRADFGDDRDLADKMVALETILDRVDLGCLSLVDLRVPAAPTVRRSVASGDGSGGPQGASAAGSEEPLAETEGC